MKNDNHDFWAIVKVLSALFGSALIIVAILLSFQIWILKPAVILPYSALLVISGWAFAFAEMRVVGLIHGALMFGVAALCFYICFTNLNVPLGDNPAAGLIGAATLVYFIIGTLSGLFGLGISYIVLKKA